MKPFIKDSIYPFNLENVSALLNFYLKGKLSISDYDVNSVLAQKDKINLNELEFIVRAITYNLDFFKDRLNHKSAGNYTTYNLEFYNLFSYGIDAYFDNDPGEFRKNITKEFKQILFDF